MLVRLTILAIGLGMLTFGGLLVAWSAQTAYSFHWRLERGDAVRTDARVEDFRTIEDERRRHRTHELRYVFAVPGDDTEYVHDDDIWFIEQEAGWVDVSEDVWERSRDSGEITVEYLEDDPTVSQPVDARRGIGSVILFAILGIVALLIGTAITIGPQLGRRRRRAEAADATSGPFV